MALPTWDGSQAMEVVTPIMVVIVLLMIETSGVELVSDSLEEGVLFGLVKETPRAAGRSAGVSPGRLTPLDLQMPTAYENESCSSLTLGPALNGY